MSESSKTKVVHAGEGTRIAVAGDLYRFLGEGKDTGQSYAIMEALVPPGGGPPPHVHSRESEGFYILEGEIAFTADGQKVIAREGSYLNIPKGVVHAFRNESDADARMLILVAPAGMEKMFEEAGNVVADPSARPSPPTPQELEKLIAVAPKYGIEILLDGKPTISTAPKTPQQ